MLISFKDICALASIVGFLYACYLLLVAFCYRVVVIMKVSGSKTMLGYRSRLKLAINASTDGATCELELASAEAILDMVDQLIRIEQNHEAPNT